MNLITATKSGLDVLRAGRAMLNPAVWKQRQAVLIFLTAVVSLAQALGVPLTYIPLDAGSLNGLAALVSGAAIILTYATSDKVGVPFAERLAAILEMIGKTNVEEIPTPSIPTAAGAKRQMPPQDRYIDVDTDAPRSVRPSTVGRLAGMPKELHSAPPSVPVTPVSGRVDGPDLDRN